MARSQKKHNGVSTFRPYGGIPLRDAGARRGHYLAKLAKSLCISPPHPLLCHDVAAALLVVIVPFLAPERGKDKSGRSVQSRKNTAGSHRPPLTPATRRRAPPVCNAGVTGGQCCPGRCRSAATTLFLRREHRGRTNTLED